MKPRRITIKAFERSWPIICVVGLTAIGFYLRARNLGSQSLHASDEGVFALAVKGILDTGRPLLPLNEIYPRSPLTTYLVALVSKFFGFNDASLRSVGVFFSTLTIPLSYLFAREIFKDSLMGLFTAAILAFSAWQVEIARQVKFYAPFNFFYLLSIYFFYKAFFQNKEIYRLLFLISYTAAIFTNILGVTLIMAFGLFAVSKRRLWSLSKSWWGYLFITISIFLIWAGYNSILMHKLPHRLERGSVGLFGHSSFILPNLRMSFDFFKSPNPLFYLVWFGLLLSWIVYILRFCQFRKEICWQVSVVILACGGQVVLAGLCLVAYLFFECGSISFKDKKFAVPLAAIVSFFIFWSIYGLLAYSQIAQMDASVPERFRQVLRELLVFNYPHLIYLYLMAIMFPIMSFFVYLGLIPMLNISFKGRGNSPLILTLGMFLTPMLIMGGTFAVGHNEARRISCLYTFFVMIYVYSLVKLADWASSRLLKRQSQKRQYQLKILLLVLLVPFSLEHAGPKEAFAISERRHGEKINPMFALSSKQYVQMDFKGTAGFVKSRLKESDVVVYAGFPPNIFFYYIGRVDYVIRPGDKVYAKSVGYTTAKHIILPEFERMVSTTRKRLWLIVNKNKIVLSSRKSRNLADEISNKYIERRQYISSDNNFEVYLFEP